MTDPEDLPEPRHPAGAAAPQTIVLDTNVVLDWLLFRDPACTLLGDGIFTGRLRWLASAAMRDEFCHVLTHGGTLAAWAPDADALLASWDRWSQPMPNAAGTNALRCRDPDDQKFIDLALAQRARWLLSRDKAVLRLARAALRADLMIATPARWSATWATNSSPSR